MIIILWFKENGSSRLINIELHDKNKCCPKSIMDKYMSHNILFYIQ